MKIRKILVTMIACLSLILCTMVGTIAWLTDQTGTVTNTFTPSDIAITLTEEKVGVDFKFKMVPGATIDKDPTVKVDNDIDCYVFVKVDESATLNTYISWAIAEGWTPLTDANGDGKADNGVYYRTVAANATNKVFEILGAGPNALWSDNQVYVKTTVTKADMRELNDDNAVQPTLAFTAYAIQKDYLTHADGATDAQKAADAWALLNPNP